MKATFGTTKKGTWAYIQKSVRIDGRMAAPGDKGLRIVRYSDGSVKKVWTK